VQASPEAARRAATTAWNGLSCGASSARLVPALAATAAGGTSAPLPAVLQLHSACCRASPQPWCSLLHPCATVKLMHKRTACSSVDCLRTGFDTAATAQQSSWGTR
jgi:hypothetical protein